MTNTQAPVVKDDAVSASIVRTFLAVTLLTSAVSLAPAPLLAQQASATKGAPPPSPPTTYTPPGATEPQPMPNPLRYPVGTVIIPTNPTAADVPAMMWELTRAKRTLDDWPALNRYAADNAKVAPPAAGEQRVVFLGDSITDAWDDPKYGGFFPGKPYIDRGISGQTTPQMVLRMQADVIALKPKVMVLLAGTNDLASNTGFITIEQTKANITSIAELCVAHGIKVVLSSVLPTGNYHVNPEDPRGPQTTRRPLEKILAINAWMKAYAAEHGHVYLDYYSAVVDAQGMMKIDISGDDLHPNLAGYALMAPLAEAAIQQALAKK